MASKLRANLQREVLASRKMVQQPFGPQQTQANRTTLALPAIVAGQQGPLNSTTPTATQAAYSAQEGQYYPAQQIIKQNNQPQQYVQQQQARLNGLANSQQQAANFLQQESPNSSSNQQPQQQDGLYNRGPIYAPKPALYAQQAVYAAGRSPMVHQQAFYNTSGSNLQQQQQGQQHSPASVQSRSNQMQPIGLSVRQLTNGVSPVAVQPMNLSPAQQTTQLMQQNADQQHQRQQQMQQLIMSYQQQQQINNLQSSDVQMAPQQTYVSQSEHQPPTVSDMRWVQYQEEQRQLQQHQHPQQSRHQHLYTSQQQQPSTSDLHNERLVGAAANRAARFSDRDSLSTLSRFNQFDERRSFTMRSQYTSANHNQLNRTNRNFSFLHITTAAIKKIIGLSNASDEIRKRNFHKNLIDANNDTNNGALGANKSVFNQASAGVTVIDAPEDYYFKKKVFKYQLVIMRIMSLLSAAFVLFSPVAMLLIPKMEFIFNPNAHDFASDNPQGSNTEPSNQSPTPSITNAVGLTSKQALGQRQPPYYMPQPQWRISECTSDCDGLLIGFVMRLIMLCIAYWAIFFRVQTASLPRIDFQRCLLTSMAVLITLAYWLFFVFRLFDKRFNDFELQYISIVQFAMSMLESLILLHYLAVVLLELRARKKIYCLKVVRSPDGQSQYYSCGSLSIQKCAQFVLEKYHRQFTQYGPHAEQLIEFEDRHARNTNGHREDEQVSGNDRSRPNSPAGSQSGLRSTRRSTSRTSRRNRSPSRSPVRERSRSQRKLNDTSKASNQGAGHHANPMETNHQSTGDSNDRIEIRPQEQDGNNSTDQLSDTTSRVKESSLETVRAANPTDLQKNPSSDNQQSTSLKKVAGQDLSIKQQQHRPTRDETESVRSVRSRRSTVRSHHRHRDKERERERDRDHHGHHRDRSSSRANDKLEYNRHSTFLPPSQVDPLEEHEKKLRRRKLRLLLSVQEAFEQIRRTNEGKCSFMQFCNILRHHRPSTCQRIERKRSSFF